MADDENDVILQRITITRRLRGDDGHETVKFEYDDDINWVTDLGMLSAAQVDLTERMRVHWDEESS